MPEKAEADSLSTTKYPILTVGAVVLLNDSIL